MKNKGNMVSAELLKIQKGSDAWNKINEAMKAAEPSEQAAPIIYIVIMNWQYGTPTKEIIPGYGDFEIINKLEGLSLDAQKAILWIAISNHKPIVKKPKSRIVQLYN
jgi:hypothetical protein